MAPFHRKLQEKKQTRVQQRQAADAVALYFDLIGVRYPTAKLPPHPKISSGKHAFFKDVRQSSVKEAPFPWLPWPSIWRKRIADCRASSSFVPIDRLPPVYAEKVLLIPLQIGRLEWCPRAPV